MREGTREEVRSEITKEVGIANRGVRDGCGIVQRHSDLVRLDELEHAREKHALQLETALVIRVRQHVEDVLHNAQEVLLEERVRNCWICACEVVDNLQAHYIRVSDEHTEKGLNTCSSGRSRQCPSSCA